jgi:uncharacterized phage protein (TIGR02218 family)
MKTISTELETHISGEVTSLATCWKLTRKDNTVFGFTSHDRDIVFESATYKASSGFTPSAIETSGALSVDNLDVDGILSADIITEKDILSGRYDLAAIEIFQVNYTDLSQGKLHLKSGILGEVSVHKKQFVAEIRGLTQQLSQTIGELYSPSCRATLGDGRCKVNIASHTVSGSVTSKISDQQFTDNSRSETSGLFTSGMITFTGGSNAGISMEVKEYLHSSASGGEIILVLPMPYTVSITDSYSITKGCDKTLGICKQRFDNIANFRGEPHVPGLDRILETAGTRSQ